MIALAYADLTPDRSALYRGLISGLIDNINTVCPGEKLLLLTDDTTPLISGVSQVLRVPRTMGLMTWRLKCHQLAHGVADEILFIEPDVRFSENVMSEFAAGDFDVSITTREAEVILADDRIASNYGFGVMYSKSQDFWREAKLYCQTLSEKYQNWFGDMLAIEHVLDSGQFRVKVMPGAIYNHVVNDPCETSDAKVRHYKGKRKAWLFDQAVEA